MEAGNNNNPFQMIYDVVIANNGYAVEILKRLETLEARMNVTIENESSNRGGEENDPEE